MFVPPCASERVEIAIGLAEIIRGRRGELVAEGAHVAREVDETEPVVGAQCANELTSCGSCLFHLSSLHRAGHVEHQRDVARCGFATHRRRRRHRDQGKAILVARCIREHADRRRRVAANRWNEQCQIARVAADRRDSAAVTIGEIERVCRRIW